MTATQTVAAVVRHELRRRGLSQAYLARELGESEPVVSKKMNAKSPWSLAELDKLAAMLDVPLPVLLMAPVGAGVGVSTPEYAAVRVFPTVRYGPPVTPVSRATLAAA